MTAVGRWLPAALLGTGLIALAVTPRAAGSLVVFVLAVFSAGAILAARPGPLVASRDTLATLGVMAAGPLALTLSALLSDNRYIGFVGRMNQHNGAMLWLAALAIAASMALRPLPGDVERTVKAIAVCAGVLGVAVIAEMLGVPMGARFSPEPAGFFESSQTLGQVLVLGVGCSVAWVLTARSGFARTVALSVVVTCAGALWGSNSRAAIGSALVAGLALGILRAVAARREGGTVPAPAAAAAWTTGIAAGVTLLGAGLAVQDSAWWWPALNSALTDRLSVWRGAVSAIAGSPLVGRGPDQFQTLLPWDAAMGGAPPMTVAGDAHNLVLTMAATGGVIGALAALLTLAAAVWGIAAALGRARSSLPVLIAAAALFGWFLTLQFAWVGGYGVLAASLLTGALLGAGHKPSSSVRRATWAGTGAGVLLLAAVFAATVSLWSGFSAEWRWAHLGEVASFDQSMAVAMQSPDPGMKSAVLGDAALGAIQAPPEGAYDILSPLAEGLRRDRGWSVTASYALIAHEYVGAATGVRTTDDLREAVEAAQLSDSVTPTWDYLGAVYAANLGDQPASAGFARAALEHPVGGGARAWLESRPAVDETSVIERTP